MFVGEAPVAPSRRICHVVLIVYTLTIIYFVMFLDVMHQNMHHGAPKNNTKTSNTNKKTIILFSVTVPDSTNKCFFKIFFYGSYHNDFAIIFNVAVFYLYIYICKRNSIIHVSIYLYPWSVLGII